MNSEIEIKTFKYETVEKMSAVAADYVTSGWRVEAVRPRGCTILNHRGSMRVDMVLVHRAPYNDHGARTWR